MYYLVVTIARPVDLASTDTWPSLAGNPTTRTAFRRSFRAWAVRPPPTIVRVPCYSCRSRRTPRGGRSGSPEA